MEESTVERDYLHEAQEIIAGRSLYLPQREHLIALADLINELMLELREAET